VYVRRLVPTVLENDKQQSKHCDKGGPGEYVSFYLEYEYEYELGRVSCCCCVIYCHSKKFMVQTTRLYILIENVVPLYMRVCVWGGGGDLMITSI
jgi:hypothetical protein